MLTAMRQASGLLEFTQSSLQFEADHLALGLNYGRSLSFVVFGSGPDSTIEPTGSLI
jgi:hypothetical protein